MRKMIFIFIVLLGAIILDIDQYVELNDLAIIEGIGIIYDDNKYTIILKEVIPKKDENGIKYEYKYYDGNSYNYKISFNNILKNTNKKIYLNKVKVIITNYDDYNKIIKYLKVKPDKVIFKDKNIKKELVEY